MQPYALGLDLGIASIGWAIGPLDEDNDVTDVAALGTFCYPTPVAEVKKGRRITNRSNRGAKRRARHRLHHFKARRKKLLRELIARGWWPEDENEQIRLRTRKLRTDGGQIELAHPIALKVKALSEPVSTTDLACIFLHYQRHRGYLSTADLPALLRHQRPGQKKVAEVEVDESKLTEEQKEIRGLNNWIRTTRERLGGRSISEFQLDILEERETPSGDTAAVRARLRPRNRELDQIQDKTERAKAKAKQKPATDLRYDRWMYIEEFERIWERQALFNPELTVNLREKLEALIFHQDPLEAKDDEVGMCELLPNYRRCRTGELVFQRHRILSTLAHLRLGDRRLTSEERRAGLEFLLVRERCTYGQLKEALQIPAEARFKDEPLPAAKGGKGKDKVRAAGRDVVRGSDWGRRISEALGVSGAQLAEGKHYDALVHDLISLGEVARVNRLVEHYGIDDETALVLANLETPEGYAKRCSRALRRIEPFLFEADDLDQATAQAGYRTADQRIGETKDRLEVRGDWTTGNPSVDAAVRWSAKVVNQIIDRYGKPAVIRVELPRQMAMGNEQRAEEWERINKRADLNKSYAEKLEKAGRPVTRRNLMRMQLADESGWCSPYEPDQKIGSTEDLIDHYELDHIVPQSYAAEDGLSNLVLCPTALNQRKGAQTPWEAFREEPERWAKITAFVSTCRGMGRRKRERILAKERPEQGMEARMLTQMGYVGTQITALLKTLNVDCQFVNGSITAEVRHLYGLNTLLPKEEAKPKIASGEEFGAEKNRLDLRHHALDAATILLVNRSLAQRLTRYFQGIEDWRRSRKPGEKPTLGLEEPFPVRKRLSELLPSIPVVHPPSRKLRGALHKETLQPLAEFAAMRGQPGQFEVRGRYVLRFDDEGRVSGAWLKDSVHHGKIYRLLSGKRELRSVSLFEVAQILSENLRRERRGLRPVPIIDRTPPSAVHRFEMSISNGDIVELAEGKSVPAGFYRIGTVAVGETFEISMFPVTAAKSDPKATGSVRIRSVPQLDQIVGRVILNAFGEVVFREPATDD